MAASILEKQFYQKHNNFFGEPYPLQLRYNYIIFDIWQFSLSFWNLNPL
jgi:hypothetical protein